MIPYYISLINYIVEYLIAPINNMIKTISQLQQI